MNTINEMKKSILRIAHLSKNGHIASSFSCLDMLWVLYDKVINVTPRTTNDKNRDRFILSKAHASLGLLVVLAEKGFIQLSELDTYCQYNSRFGSHLNHTKINGVEFSGGSLGHGATMAIGLAAGMKMNGIDSKVYCVLGDMECNEGEIWSTALIADKFELNNLVYLIDHNHSSDNAVNMGSIKDKFIHFGWNTDEICGHDHDQLYDALTRKTDKSKAIICHTVKGKGCKIMENNPEWHHKAPNDEELRMLLEELSQ